MNKTSLLLIVLILPGLLGFVPLPANAAAPSSAILASPVLHSFGYVQSTPDWQWIDIAQEGNDKTILFSSNLDDGNVNMGIGFDFPFFENTYATAWVSTNGVLIFTNLIPEATHVNRAIPFPVDHNNLIAPFWDDLTLGTSGAASKIYTKTIQDEGTCNIGAPECFVVEWYVTRLRNNTPLLFEVVLGSNGNVRFNYSDMSADPTVSSSATIGIENQDGVDGLQYLYDEPGLMSNSSLLFTFPGGERYGVRASVRYLSGFLQSNVARLPLHLVNTGNVISGVSLGYTITGHSYSSGEWDVTFLDSTGLPANPVLQPAGSDDDQTDVFLQITAPEGSQPGDFIQLDVMVMPAGHEEQIFSLTSQAAIPADFAQCYADLEAEDMEIAFVRQSGVHRKYANFWYNGSTLTFGGTSTFGYLFAWEAQQKENNTALIQYVFANSLSDTVSRPRNLSAKKVLVRDRFPKVSIANNGRIGIMFVRANYTHILDGDIQYDDPTWNVYLALLNSSGSQVKPFINLTGNSLKYGGDHGPTYESAPSIAAQGNNFFMVWKQVNLTNNGSSQDLYMAVYNANGEVVKAKTKLTSSAPGENLYGTPDLTALADGRVLLTYTATHPIEGSRIAYRVFSRSGGPVKAETFLSGAKGDSAEAVELTNMNVVIAWVADGMQVVNYALLDPSATQMGSEPAELTSPSGLGVDYLSITQDRGQHVILTWGDNYSKMIYYALLGDMGDVVTPPLSFHSESNLRTGVLYLSAAGEGSAPLTIVPIHRLYMPLDGPY